MQWRELLNTNAIVIDLNSEHTKEVDDYKKIQWRQVKTTFLKLIYKAFNHA
ncbi:hypothetical protein [Terrimonas sp.]|uniref:hypothetical protein n=1 Tax=Terrimonas sp. TaxID=1914338 RepID=UPI001402FACD|nr:hypothetical protein [Terrimonas sp.]